MFSALSLGIELYTFAFQTAVYFLTFLLGKALPWFGLSRRKADVKCILGGVFKMIYLNASVSAVVTELLNYCF